jgi:hypothetical protein
MPPAARSGSATAITSSVGACMLGLYQRPVEKPDAPSASASAKRLRIRSISPSRAGRITSPPMASTRSAMWPQSA